MPANNPAVERVPYYLGNVNADGVRHAEATPNASPASTARPAGVPEGAIPWDQDLHYDPRCQATTSAGDPCKARPVNGEEFDTKFCIFHQPDHEL